MIDPSLEVDYIHIDEDENESTHTPTVDWDCALTLMVPNTSEYPLWCPRINTQTFQAN